VAVDGSGNVYVADTGNHIIRIVSSAGFVSTFAGWPGIAGASDGLGSAARFNNPNGVAVDASGNVYVADTANHTIRRVSSAGFVSTFAGSPGIAGASDGVGPAARFNNPKALAVDASGNVYVADTFNHTIRRVSSTGAVNTLAGVAGAVGSADGTGSAAHFNLPGGIAVDGAGNLFVADAGNHTIRRVSSAGVVSTLSGLAGTAGSTDGSAGQLILSVGTVAAGTNPFSVTVDPTGKFAYVVNNGSSNVSAYRINPSTGTLTSVGAPVVAGTSPVSVTVDPTGKFAYVANFNSNNVSAFTINASTGALTPAPDSPFQAGTNPVSVAVDRSGKFAYVANSGSSNVSAYAINASTGALTLVGAPIAAGTNPISVTVDTSGNFAYVANLNSNNVSAFTINASSGALTPAPGSPFQAGANPFSVTTVGAIQ
jgi:DNA-binding beta-propeller fold protein YncE